MHIINKYVCSAVHVLPYTFMTWKWSPNPNH